MHLLPFSGSLYAKKHRSTFEWCSSVCSVHIYSVFFQSTYNTTLGWQKTWQWSWATLVENLDDAMKRLPGLRQGPANKFAATASRCKITCVEDTHGKPLTTCQKITCIILKMNHQHPITCKCQLSWHLQPNRPKISFNSPSFNCSPPPFPSKNPTPGTFDDGGASLTIHVHLSKFQDLRDGHSTKAEKIAGHFQALLGGLLSCWWCPPWNEQLGVKHLEMDAWNTIVSKRGPFRPSFQGRTGC